MGGESEVIRKAFALEYGMIASMTEIVLFANREQCKSKYPDISRVFVERQSRNRSRVVTESARSLLVQPIVTESLMEGGNNESTPNRHCVLGFNESLPNR